MPSGGVTSSQVSNSLSVPLTESLLSSPSPSPPQVAPVSSYRSPPPPSTADKKLLSPRVSGEGSHSSESVTPIPSEVSPDRGDDDKEGDRTLTEEEVSEEEIEEKLEGDQAGYDIDEISFREVLPSESHRLRRKKQIHLHLHSNELDPISVRHYHMQ